MKRAVKNIMLTMAVVLLLGAAAIGTLRVGFGIDVFDRSGWYEPETGGRQYRLYNGTPMEGWQTVDGMTCYFDPADNCTLATGWVELEAERYWFASTGAVTTGWAQLEGGRYHFAADGAMDIGWLELNGADYYLGADGVMVTGWADIDGARHWFGEDGVMAVGWTEIDGSRYYFDTNGVMVTGWQEWNGDRYYFAADGAMVTGWLEQEEGRYWFDETGVMATGWLELGEKRYWLTPSGVAHTGWLEVPGSRRFFREDGAMAVGRAVIDGVTRHFDSRGQFLVLVNPWNTVPEDYSVKLAYVEGFRVAAQCKKDLMAMMGACRAAGHGCDISSGYRTHAYQDSLWSGQVERYVAQGYSRAQAEAITSKSIAVPGTSEHQLGLAVDLTRESGTYEWLAKHSWEYGFTLRYPYGKTEHTGIYYEPWHFRYVGRELAKELYDLGLCLEEYLDLLTEQQGYES